MGMIASGMGRRMHTQLSRPWRCDWPKLSARTSSPAVIACSSSAAVNTALMRMAPYPPIAAPVRRAAVQGKKAHTPLGRM